MRFLVDTSVWTQRLLGQTDAAEADAFLRAFDPQDFASTTFAWHSIGATCARREVAELFLDFTDDVVAPGHVQLLTLDAADMPAVVSAMQQYRLDFDDAYQYVAAEKHGLEIVALDRDFAEIPHGYQRPAESRRREVHNEPLHPPRHHRRHAGGQRDSQPCRPHVHGHLHRRRVIPRRADPVAPGA